MKSVYLSLSLLVCGVVLGSAAGCVVEFPDELPYTCTEDADCGGQNHVCTALPDGRRYCCLPGPEVCNRVDDDCDGEVDELESDTCYTGPAQTLNVGQCRTGKPVCGEGNILCAGEVLPVAEVCNGKDDDCDGQIDEDFDFQTGNNNCGRCDQACTELQECMGGECVRRQETQCENGEDDDLDELIDCADPDCNGLPCGAGCRCIAGQRGEAECGNGVNDDGDGATDCADSDCDGRVCGAGCSCINGVRGESECGNVDGLGAEIDDDGDGAANCADSDCDGRECGAGCLCQGNVRTETECGDNVDNDGSGGTDCADSDCAGQACGVGCLCQGGAKVEVACSDEMDNDGDGLIDCADPQCDTQVCKEGDTGTACKRRQCQEIRCFDTLDNDGDGLTDCEDPDCEGVATASNAQVCTVANGLQELNCTNNQDDDGDGRIDCRTNGQGSEPNCLDGGICGVGCQYTNSPGSTPCNGKREVLCDDGVDNDGNQGTDCADPDCNGKSCNFLGGCICNGTTKKETVCDDGLDNDGNNGADCSDQVDCPQGTVCRKTDGTAGTCNGSRQCT